MGVIARQSIKQSIVTYLGIIIGSISTLFIYPRIGSDGMGEIAFIQTTGKFLAALVGVGLPAVSIQYFPYFKETAQRRGRFFAGLLIFTFISSLLTLFLFYIFQKYLGHFFSNANLLNKYSLEILVTAVIISFITIIQSYTANFERIVVPSILQNLTLKIWQPILILLFLINFINFTGVINGIIICYGFILLGLVFYLIYLGKWEWHPINLFTNKQKVKEIFTYSLFSISVNWGSLLATQIDALLVGLIVGATSLAIFTIPSMIAEAIDVPRKAILGIAAPIISNSIKKGDWANVLSIYKKAAIIQLIVGSFLLAAAWVCSDSLYDIMPNGEQFRAGKYIILVLGLARIVDMITGTNSEIISYSEYYRMNLKFLIYMSVINIIGNLILIPLFKTNSGLGAAIATLISVSIFNVLKLHFIYKKFKIHPLDKRMLSVILFALVATTISYICPPLSNPFLTIFYKTFILSVLYWACILYFSISNDINTLVAKFITDLIKKIKKT